MLSFFSSNKCGFIVAGDDLRDLTPNCFSGDSCRLGPSPLSSAQLL